MEPRQLSLQKLAQVVRWLSPGRPDVPSQWHETEPLSQPRPLPPVGRALSPGGRLAGLPLAACTIGPGGVTPEGRRTALDLLAPPGSKVMVVARGKVVYSGVRGGLGACIGVLHDDGRISRYSHLGERLVFRGAKVRRGQVIGEVGSSGSAARPMLRFDVLWQGCYCDPMDYLLARGCLSAELAYC
jgi:murein DD-endopeptidase MepM/ murein hydrolase activator NlpD